MYLEVKIMSIFSKPDYQYSNNGSITDIFNGSGDRVRSDTNDTYGRTHYDASGNLIGYTTADGEYDSSGNYIYDED